MRHAGPQRLRLLLGVERLTFRYYTERFGTIVLPRGERIPLG